MPDDFSERIRHYITEGGRVRSRAELREQIDLVTDYVAKQAKVYASQLVEGAITRAEFEARMLELLRSGHIIASTVGRGGIARMQAADWARVAQKIGWQEKFLRRFGRLIANDSLSGPASSNRAALYADSLQVSFYRAVYADQSDRPQSVGKDGQPLQVKLVQNSQEGCEECAADAAEGFMALDEMGEIGSRICGDWCKCDLIFSDDDNETIQ